MSDEHWNQVKLDIKPLSVNQAYTIRKNHSTGKPFFGGTKDLKQYKNQIGWLFQEKGLEDLPKPYPVDVEVKYYFKRKHRSDEQMEGKPFPDVTNPSKPLLDALEGQLWDEDTQIMSIHQAKFSCEDDPYIILRWRWIN